MSPRRIPTKAELLRLQKLYRTDKKIADMLGNGVTDYLVAYWRRKKGIPLYSFPKFSEKEIQEVWDRFGDDFNAGMELNISKAAFYNWRRKYKITKKPEALKLEQLTLELYTNDKKTRRQIGSGHQTIIQKNIAARIGKKDIPIGEELEVEPDQIISTGYNYKIMQMFRETEKTYVFNPNRIIIPLDGELPNKDISRASVLKEVRDFIHIQQIKNYFDIGEGDGFQVALEKGLLLPGQLIVGNGNLIYAGGSLGALALTIPLKELALVWAEGKTTIKVPETIRIILTGRLPRGVFVQDLRRIVLLWNNWSNESEAFVPDWPCGNLSVDRLPPRLIPAPSPENFHHTFLFYPILHQVQPGLS